MHKPHVVPFWAMDWPEDWIRDYLVRQNEDPARSPLLGLRRRHAGRLHRGLRPGARRARRARARAAGRHRRARADRRRGAPRPLLAWRSGAPSCASCSSARACCGSSASPTSATTSSSRCSRSSGSASRVRSTCPTSAPRSWSASATDFERLCRARRRARRPAMSLALELAASSSATASGWRSTASTSTVRAGRDASRCSDPTARASRRWSRSPRGLLAARRGRACTVRGRPGLAPQEIGIYPSLTVRENLWAFAELHGVSRKRARSGCSSRSCSPTLADRPRGAAVAAASSGGCTRRSRSCTGRGWCCSTSRPRAPTRRRAPPSCDAVRDLAADGTAVVYTTHYLPEVEELDADVALLEARADHRRRARSSELVAAARARASLEVTFTDGRVERRPGRVAARPGRRRDPRRGHPAVAGGGLPGADRAAGARE